MPRQKQNVEFLQKLKALSEIDRISSFSKACRKANPNMVAYYYGRATPGKRFLQSCLTNLYGWGVVPLMEIANIPLNLNSLPKDAGVYIIYDSGAQVIYVGKATNFQAEVRQALGRKIPVGLRLGPKLKKKQPQIKDLATHLSLYGVASPRLRHNIEVLLLRVFANQTHNSNIGNFT